MSQLHEAASIALHQPPQGYFHAGDDAALFAAVLRLRESAGEFEKAKFFDYKQKICAHTRNGQIGCTACIDVCSAAAIRSDAATKGRTGAGGIFVEPHLCVGCGACTTVCPSGALGYATPRPDEQGTRIRTCPPTHSLCRDAALLTTAQAVPPRSSRRPRSAGGPGVARVPRGSCRGGLAHGPSASIWLPRSLRRRPVWVLVTH